jgi:hypothetical protein
MALEKVVRPAQTGEVTPPRRVVNASEGPTEQAGFKAGRGGSGKSMNGSYSFQQTFYCEQHVNEFRSTI